MTLATILALRAAEAKGLVTLKSLCRELGVSGSSARLKLRGRGYHDDQSSLCVAV